jgi:hypothetical protein
MEKTILEFYVDEDLVCKNCHGKLRTLEISSKFMSGKEVADRLIKNIPYTEYWSAAGEMLDLKLYGYSLIDCERCGERYFNVIFYLDKT